MMRITHPYAVSEGVDVPCILYIGDTLVARMVVPWERWLWFQVYMRENHHVTFSPAFN